MNYAEYGLEQKDTIIFLHGGGLAPWNYFEEVRHLQICNNRKYTCFTDENNLRID